MAQPFSRASYCLILARLHSTRTSENDLLGRIRDAFLFALFASRTCRDPDRVRQMSEYMGAKFACKMASYCVESHTLHPSTAQSITDAPQDSQARAGKSFEGNSGVRRQEKPCERPVVRSCAPLSWPFQGCKWCAKSRLEAPSLDSGLRGCDATGFRSKLSDFHHLLWERPHARRETS